MCTSTCTFPLVLVKDGEGPPVIIAHGLCGTVQIGKLARHIRIPNPVYGIQAQGVDGTEDPLQTIEEMASYYTDAIEKLSSGALYLVGYSFGGLVAMELAQRLQAKGKQLLLLVLLDTYPHPHFLSPVLRTKLFIQRMRSHGRSMLQMPARSAWKYFWNAVKRRLHLVKERDLNQSEPELSPSNSNPTLLRVKETAFDAYTRYQPKFYSGKVSFVTTATKTFFPQDPAAVWKDLIPDLQVEVVPGDHLNILTTEFESLAAVLTKLLAQADQKLPR